MKQKLRAYIPSAAKYFVLNNQVDMTSKIIILFLTSKSKLSSNFHKLLLSIQ